MLEQLFGYDSHCARYAGSGGGRGDGGDGEGGGGGDGEGGGGEEDEEDEEDQLQIVKPDLVTEPSVYHDIVWPELMLTPLRLLVPEYLVPPTVM